MSKSSLHFGLQTYIILAALFGIQHYQISEKKWRRINLIQCIYHNILFIIGTLSIVFYSITVIFLVHARYTTLISKNTIMSALNVANEILSRFLWIAAIYVLTFYTKFYRKNLSLSLKKLLLFSKVYGIEVKENFLIFFLSFGLNLLFLFVYIFFYGVNGTPSDVSKWLLYIYYFYGNTFPIVYCGLFFCIVEQLVSITDHFKEKIYCWNCSKLVLKKTKFLRVSSRAIQIQWIEKFKEKVFIAFEISCEIFVYFQVPISLLFLNDLLYVIAELTRFASTSEFKLNGILNISINAALVITILITSDSYHKKVSKMLKMFSFVINILILNNIKMLRLRKKLVVVISLRKCN